MICFVLNNNKHTTECRELPAMLHICFIAAANVFLLTIITTVLLNLGSAKAPMSNFI